jgi:hypothetical protein
LTIVRSRPDYLKIPLKNQISVTSEGWGASDLTSVSRPHQPCELFLKPSGTQMIVFPSKVLSHPSCKDLQNSSSKHSSAHAVGTYEATARDGLSVRDTSGVCGESLGVSPRGMVGVAGIPPKALEWQY